MTTITETMEAALAAKRKREETLIKWDKRFLDLATHISQWSKDPSTKVGAVIADDKRLVSVGYNGLPQGVEDTNERLNNRDLKYKIIVHGEINAMNFAREPLKGFTLYTVPFMPCSVCAGQVIQHGFSRVVAPNCNNERWNEMFKLTAQLFYEAGIELVLY